MKAGVLVAPKRIEIVDVPNPVPGDGEVLIRIRQTGHSRPLDDIPL